MEVPTNYLYEYIKNKSLHRMIDTNHAMEILQNKFLNKPEQILEVLKDAVDSESLLHIHEIDKKYGYDGTISNLYKIVKPSK